VVTYRPIIIQQCQGSVLSYQLPFKQITITPPLLWKTVYRLIPNFDNTCRFSFMFKSVFLTFGALAHFSYLANNYKNKIKS